MKKIIIYTMALMPMLILFVILMRNLLFFSNGKKLGEHINGEIMHKLINTIL